MTNSLAFPLSGSGSDGPSSSLGTVRKLDGHGSALIRCIRGRFLAGRVTARRNSIHVRSPGRASKIPGYRNAWYRAGGISSCDFLPLRRPDFCDWTANPPGNYFNHLDALRSEKQPRQHDLNSLSEAFKPVAHSLVAPAFHEQKMARECEHAVQRISAFGAKSV